MVCLWNILKLHSILVSLTCMKYFTCVTVLPAIPLHLLPTLHAMQVPLTSKTGYTHATPVLHYTLYHTPRRHYTLVPHTCIN